MAAGPGWVTDRETRRGFCPCCLLLFVGGFSFGSFVGFGFSFYFIYIYWANSNKSSAPAGMLHSRARLGDPPHTQTRTDRPSPASRRPRNGAVPPPAGEGGTEEGEERRGGREGRKKKKEIIRSQAQIYLSRAGSESVPSPFCLCVY